MSKTHWSIFIMTVSSYTLTSNDCCDCMITSQSIGISYFVIDEKIAMKNEILSRTTMTKWTEIEAADVTVHLVALGVIGITRIIICSPIIW